MGDSMLCVCRATEERGANKRTTVLLGISTKGVLARVGDVQEAVLVLVLLVDGRHQGGGWGQDLVHKDEDGLLGRQLDAFADHVHELADSQICGNQVLLLVDRRDIRLLDLFANHLFRS